MNPFFLALHVRHSYSHSSTTRFDKLVTKRFWSWLSVCETLYDKGPGRYHKGPPSKNILPGIQSYSCIHYLRFRHVVAVIMLVGRERQCERFDYHSPSALRTASPPAKPARLNPLALPSPHLFIMPRPCLRNADWQSTHSQTNNGLLYLQCQWNGCLQQHFHNTIIMWHFIDNRKYQSSSPVNTGDISPEEV